VKGKNKLGNMPFKERKRHEKWKYFSQAKLSDNYFGVSVL